MSIDNQRNIDHEILEPVPSTTAADILRQMATRLQHANYQASTARVSSGDAQERARQLDFALLHLASTMQEAEVINLIYALRQAAEIVQQDYLCEFCGEAIQPWSMIIGDLSEPGADPAALAQHTWDHFGVTLCKACYLAIRQVQWQAATQM